MKAGTTITMLLSSPQATTDIDSLEQTMELALLEKPELKELKLLMIIIQLINVLLKL
jgi:hypothetical protein